MRDLPEAMPRLMEAAEGTVEVSPALSLEFRPGDGSVRTRKVAILVAGGVDADWLAETVESLQAEGVVARLVGPRVGFFPTSQGTTIEADASLESEPAVLFDGVIVPDGKVVLAALMDDGRAAEFLRDQIRHSKTLLAVGSGAQLLLQAGLPDGYEDPGLLRAKPRDTAAVARFLHALGKHRHPVRDRDPPMV